MMYIRYKTLCRVTRSSKQKKSKEKIICRTLFHPVFQSHAFILFLILTGWLCKHGIEIDRKNRIPI